MNLGLEWVLICYGSGLYSIDINCQTCLGRNALSYRDELTHEGFVT